MALAFVVTTIQAPTEGIRAIGAHAARTASDTLIVVGDRKSPETWNCAGAHFYSLKDQMELPFAIARHLPLDSYSRKMLGYLLAAAQGYEWIRETDDDNTPYESFFESVDSMSEARLAVPIDDWINIYSYFTERHIWPRGFPLSLVQDERQRTLPTTESVGIKGTVLLQAVADGDPDVDAVYRLTAPDTSAVYFNRNVPLLVPPGSWTPFNSQATTWPRVLLPLMYLPSTCTFRMTDIWRSFVAQKLMTQFDACLVITEPTVFQKRNQHNLMRDFEEEITGYLGYTRFVRILSDLDLSARTDSLLHNLKIVYDVLIREGFFTQDEGPLLDAWLQDMRALGYA